MTQAPGRVSSYDPDEAIRSLDHHDAEYPESSVAEFLRQPSNSRYLEYVAAEMFAPLFPGRLQCTPDHFAARMAADLESARSMHLWVMAPLCRYRCNFCQFPIITLNSRGRNAVDAAKEWVDLNIAEARLWLDAIPALRDVPVGEFCLFGGTPTAMPLAEIERLTEFYRREFNLASSSMRVEGAPDTLDVPMLTGLRDLGFTVLTYGIQSFDDRLLRLMNRRHTADEAREAIRAARQAGFSRVDGDLIYGLPGQTVPGFLGDVSEMIRAGYDSIVVNKLHLLSTRDSDYVIDSISPAAWESPSVRARVAEEFWWPTLGEQYQMREGAVALLAADGRLEHPSTYFQRPAVGPQIWRALTLDQDLQVPELGTGLGGYAWTGSVEAHASSKPKAYKSMVQAGELPLESISEMSVHDMESRSLRMALSSCQPVRDSLFRSRGCGGSLADQPWGGTFDTLVSSGLVTREAVTHDVTLTPVGATLVEAILSVEEW
jgi:oxygen-independent coproporphyrinogen III oxidase